MEKEYKKYLELARSCDEQGKYNEALTHCRKLHELKPNSIEKTLLVGDLLLKTGKKKEAYNLALSVLNREKDHPDALLIIAKIYWKEGKFEESKHLCLKIIDNNRTCAEGFAILGLINKAQGKLVEAIEFFKIAIELQPNNAFFHYNIGNTLSNLNMWKEAEAAYLECIRLDPKLYLGHQNLGYLFERQNRLEEAIKHYHSAISIAPNQLINHFNLSSVLLKAGRFQEGFAAYESRLEWHADEYKMSRLFPRWDGTSFQGKKLLVICEQGFGDCIQFIRYLSHVKKLGGFVTLWCLGSLVRLFKSVQGIDDIITGEEILEPFNYAIPLLSLPYVLKTRLDSIPNNVPYLTVDPIVNQKWKERFQNLRKCRIGITWAGEQKAVPEKSIPFLELQPLIRISHFAFISLQKGNAIIDLPKESTVLNISSYLEDFLETAGVISNLDIIITVDTAVAHLAGALGKPTILLLPFKSDWRWFTEIKTSPWYPTMRLFRQQSPGNWTDVIEQVISFLQQQKHLLK